ncbi:hypothetical protein L1049_000985 [Liquidambar formosana]|uniref:Cytochrome P450 n=1 Tax=Liquidambar formosana TaxID=63359 RepID=A0AAP0NA31_LIQFO
MHGGWPTTLHGGKTRRNSGRSAYLEEDVSTEAVTGGKVDFRYLPFGMGRRSCPGLILAVPILGLVIAKLVSNFELWVPMGMEKVDVSEKGGQFSLQIAKQEILLDHRTLERKEKENA